MVRSPTVRQAGTILFLLVAWTLPDSAARAQRRVSAGTTIPSAFTFRATASHTRTSSTMDGGTCNPSLDSILSSRGYGSGPFYAQPVYSGPYGDAAIAAAQVIDAQGRYLIDVEQSRLTRERVRQARLDTRRRLFDEYLYERQNAPTWEDDRERLQSAELRRSRNDPPLNEILSGKSLNTLLATVQKRDAGGNVGPDIGLEEDTLRRVNVTSGRGGNVGLLRNGGRLRWPLALIAEAVRAERAQIDSLLPEVVAQAAERAVNADSINALTRATERLQQYLAGHSRDLPPGQYVAAKRFLGDLEEALKALQQPDAADYLAGKRAARGRTVAEMVRSMTEQGLQFAPATSGDEAAYLALHRALASYAAGGEKRELRTR
jgi:hypothetical protein